MLTPRPANCRRGQWSLVGILVALAIILIVAAIYIPKIAARHHQPGQGATPMERANSVGCGVYLSQFSQAVSMYKQDHDGAAPNSFDQLKKYGVTDDMIHADGCSFQMYAGGVVTETGHGMAAPGAPSGTPPPPAPGGTALPGGLKLPNIPGSGSAPSGGDASE